MAAPLTNTNRLSAETRCSGTNGTLDAPLPVPFT
jgi:hypothetical protein